MPAPVIDPTQGFMGLRKGSPFTFQPYASNTPTGWVASPLPPGMTIDAPTGAISGTPTATGIWAVGVRATNGDGTSPTVVFTIGIISGGIPVTEGGADVEADLTMDVTSRIVSRAESTPLPQVLDATNTARIPLLWLKSNDVCLVNLRFVKLATAIDPDWDDVVITIKVIEPESPVLVSAGALKVGTGAAAMWQVHIPLSGSPLASALSDYEGDVDTSVAAICEVECRKATTFDGDAITKIISSANWWAAIQRELGSAA
jgi:hypothetical protein